MTTGPAHDRKTSAGPAYAAVVFDFDGTLVQSAAAKRQAFFDVFPATPAHAAIVARLLDARPDGTRFTLIPAMRAAMAGAGFNLAEADDDALITAYGKKVLEAAAAAPEVPGATALLHSLAGRCHLSIASDTPQEPLEALVRARRWERLVAVVAGLPTRKADHIAGLMRTLALRPGEVAMVGDSDSDEQAARANGCRFFRIAEVDDLSRIAISLGAGDVR